MTHLPFVAASYTLGITVPLTLAVAAWIRTNRARRRLTAIGSRRERPRS